MHQTKWDCTLSSSPLVHHLLSVLGLLLLWLSHCLFVRSWSSYTLCRSFFVGFTSPRILVPRLRHGSPFARSWSGHSSLSGSYLNVLVVVRAYVNILVRGSHGPGSALRLGRSFTS